MQNRRQQSKQRFLRVHGQVTVSKDPPFSDPSVDPESVVWPHFSASVFCSLNRLDTAKLAPMQRIICGWTFGLCLLAAFVVSGRAGPTYRTNASREITIAQRYLNLPVKNGAPQRRVQLSVDGRTERAFDIELADRTPDWWAFVDVSAWRGRKLELQVSTLPADSAALRNIFQADEIQDSRSLYHEVLRPQYHFSSRRGWNNDPNGLVFFKGYYHLFYQHNPFGWNWGNMHWGHAVSKDLLHWRELEDALAPDAFGPMFSGSAVVDWDNTSGLGAQGHPALVLIYTAAGEPAVQCLASSLDGRSFRKYDSNPVVKQITPGNRDPKVFWYKPAQKWIMTLYVETNKVNTIHFLTSSNLKDWTVTSTIGGFFECPDFFALPVDGQAAQEKWVLSAADSDYMVGSFDGSRFTPETTKLRGHSGKGYYAAQTFSDIPERDGRRIRIGWFQAPSPGMPFNQTMSVPTELNLVTTARGPRLCWTPVKELESLRTRSWKWKPFSLQPGDANPLEKAKAELVELRATFEPGEGSLLLSVRGASIAYDGKKQELVVNGQAVPAPLRNGQQRLVAYVDRTTLEVFASDGLVYLPLPFIPKREDVSLNVQAQGQPVQFTSLAVHQLKPIWRK